MATSGSTDWSPTRDQIIKAALRKCSSLDSHNTLDPSEISDAVFTLNAMVKAWMVHVDLWMRRSLTLFLQKDTTSYLLGSTAHAAETVVQTQMRVAAVATDTTMEVDSTTGMTAADNIGVALDDNSIHWTTIASVTDSDTLELTAGIPTGGAVAVDNYVYTYTTRALRPQKIIDCQRKDKNGIESQVDIIARRDYRRLSDKTTVGEPTQIVYDPQLDAGVMYVWPIDTSNTHKLELLVRYPVQDLDNAADNFEFPAEWALPLMWNLALELTTEYPVDDDVYKRIVRQAGVWYKRLNDYDVEEGPLRIAADLQGYA